MEREDLKETLEDLRAIAREADEASRRIGEANARAQSQVGSPREGSGFTSRSPRDELYRTSGVHDPHARMMSYGIAAQAFLNRESGVANARKLSSFQRKSQMWATDTEKIDSKYYPWTQEILRDYKETYGFFRGEGSGRISSALQTARMNGATHLVKQALLETQIHASQLGTAALNTQPALAAMRGYGRMQRMGLTGPSGSRQITYGTGSPGSFLAKGVGIAYAAVSLANTAMSFLEQQRNIGFAYDANMQAIANERMGDHGMTRQAVWNRMIRQEENTRKVAGMANAVAGVKAVASTGVNLAVAASVVSKGARTLIGNFFNMSSKAGPAGLAAAATVAAIWKTVDIVGGYEEARAQLVDDDIKARYEKIEKYMNNDRARAKQRSLHDAAIARHGKLWAVWKYVSNLGDESAAWSEEGLKIEKERWEKAGPLIQQGEEFIANADITHARQRFEAAAKELDTVDFQPFMWKHPMEWFTTCEQARIASNNFARSQGSRAKPRSGD